MAETTRPRFCASCGTQVRLDDRFCEDCGATLTGVQPPAANATVVRIGASAAEGGLAPGAQLAGYRIERLIARGGMGAVYEATQTSLDRRVALKVVAEDLAADESFRARFRREARIAAAIDHPGILPVYEHGEIDGQLFLAMRLVRGPDLGSMLAQGGTLDAPTTVALMTQVGAALDAAHDAGLVHRDIKPANALLEGPPESPHAYIADFGLAKRVESSSAHTQKGTLLGTVDYMAPEQIDGASDVDGRADVYAFGCMVYQCLTGEVPYPRDTVAATLYAHSSAPIPLPSEKVAGLPPVLDKVVQAAMAKDRDARPNRAGDLMRWAAGEVGGGTPTRVRVPPPPASEPDADKPIRRLRRRVGYHLIVYAPLFAGAYVLGRSL